jgi:hypothetical protein
MRVGRCQRHDWVRLLAYQSAAKSWATESEAVTRGKVGRLTDAQIPAVGGLTCERSTENRSLTVSIVISGFA